MKAAQINTYGGPEVIIVNGHVERPSPKERQVLIEVHAASINPFDWKVRAGYMQKIMPLIFPAILGGDISGVVTEIGPGVTTMKVGDKVYGQSLLFSGGTGAFAEYTVAPVEHVVLMPDNISFNEAAALPLTGVSALQVIQDHIKLQPRQKVLIHGGAGGIGSIAIQIAKHIGAYVATTASARSVDFVKQLGADEVIDYKTQKFEEILQGYDAVFDTVGSDTYKKSFVVLKKGGIIVSMLEQPDTALAEQYGVRAIVQSTKVTSESLEALEELVEKDTVKVHIDKTFPLDQIQEAFRIEEAGGIKGKVVIEIKQ